MSLPFSAHIPFVEHLGMTLERFDGGESTVRLQPRPEHRNSFDVTHGGVCMTMLDVAMATAARSVQPELGVVTIEMKTSFMRPARIAADAPGGAALEARGRLLHRTSAMAFTEATLYDDAGRACAHATGTFRYVRRAQASVSAPQPPLPTD